MFAIICNALNNDEVLMIWGSSPAGSSPAVGAYFALYYFLSTCISSLILAALGGCVGPLRRSVSVNKGKRGFGIKKHSGQ